MPPEPFMTATHASRKQTVTRRPGGLLPLAVCAAAALVCALVLAWLISVVQNAFPGSTERAVEATGALFAVVAAIATGAYLASRRSRIRAADVALVFVGVISIELLAVYFFRVGSYVSFPADFLTWSEPDFINDIAKFLKSYPLYSAPVNNDSYTYVPGPQLLTFFIARITGFAGSIPAYRTIQLGYVALAAFVAVLSFRRIIRFVRPESGIADDWRWGVFAYAALLLIATNSLTNPYVHNLHGDALCLLVNLIAFYLLLVYIDRPALPVLAAMAVIPPLGFLVKQNIVLWAGIYVLFLAIRDKSIVRAAAVLIGSALLLSAILAASYAIWGAAFFYWIFYLLSHHPVSPLRSVLHILDCWVYFAACLAGGALVLRGRYSGPLFGAWLAALVVLGVETYTSGIAWMLNHAGPGSLIAGVWLLAGVATVWNRAIEGEVSDRANAWMRAAVATVIALLALHGLSVIRVPLRPLSPDAGRYVADIERQFQGERPDRVLLDVGDWIYARNNVIMGNRAPVICEEGYCNAGDFSGFISLLNRRYYSKILVRGLHAPDFWYENSLWPRPRGLRAIMLENYSETGQIAAVEPPRDVKDRSEDPYLFGAISILEPKPQAKAGSGGL